MPNRSTKKPQNWRTQQQHKVAKTNNGIQVTVFSSDQRGGRKSPIKQQSPSNNVLARQISPEFKPQRRFIANKSSTLSISIKNDKQLKPAPRAPNYNNVTSGYVGAYERQQYQQMPTMRIDRPAFAVDGPYYRPVVAPQPSYVPAIPVSKPIPFQAQPGFQNFTIDAYDLQEGSSFIPEALKPRSRIDFNPDCCDILIANIPSSVRMGDLIPIFAHFGNIKAAKTTRDGSLHLSFETPNSAHKALSYDGAELKGSLLSVRLDDGQIDASESVRPAIKSIRPEPPRSSSSSSHGGKGASLTPDLATVLAGLHRGERR